MTLSRSVLFKSVVPGFPNRQQHCEPGNAEAHAHREQPKSPDPLMVGGNHARAATKDHCGTEQQRGTHGSGPFLESAWESVWADETRRVRKSIYFIWHKGNSLQKR
jgi:hypothetical protein